MGEWKNGRDGGKDGQKTEHLCKSGLSLGTFLLPVFLSKKKIRSFFNNLCYVGCFLFWFGLGFFVHLCVLLGFYFLFFFPPDNL